LLLAAKLKSQLLLLLLLLLQNLLKIAPLPLLLLQSLLKTAPLLLLPLPLLLLPLPLQLLNQLRSNSFSSQGRSVERFFFASPSSIARAFLNKLEIFNALFSAFYFYE
jgi:hypothetical protein